MFEAERLEKIKPMYCMGPSCPNYKYGECDEPYLDLLETDGPGGGVDLPPYKEGSSFALYGFVCPEGKNGEELVGADAEIYDDENLVKMTMKIIALAGQYGDFPVTIKDSGGSEQKITNLASSD
jgi:hypothetical protein